MRRPHLYSSRMTDPLLALEKKLDQFLEMCQGLRAENQDLRNRVLALEADRRGLSERMEQARSRIDALMSRLPEA